METRTGASQIAPALDLFSNLAPPISSPMFSFLPVAKTKMHQATFFTRPAGSVLH